MINAIQHPDYTSSIEEWTKWRLSYNGGRFFVNTYLKRLSSRETDADFTARKDITYVPRYAAAAIKEIRDSIYQRMCEVTRAGGPKSYQQACLGLLGGVDLCGSSMNTFMGTEFLDELLVMRRVGVLIDAPRYAGQLMLDKGDKHPYMTLYCSENIKSWSWYYEDNMRYLNTVLLSEQYEISNDFGLPSALDQRYRLMQRLPNGEGVQVTFFEKQEDPITKEISYKPTYTVTLQIPKIPFVIGEIPVSLMQDVADYQIALMNVESSDISFLMKSNYPFFYEFFDQKSEPEFLKPVAIPNSDGTAPQNTSRDREVKVGGSQGRRYPKGTEPPGFVNPSPETIKVSMEKCDRLKEDIYRLVNLNLYDAARSAESKKESQRTLESQLSFLGLLLQTAEVQIGEIWSLFEGSDSQPTVTYPENYSLKTEDERQAQADELSKAKTDTPSITYKKAIAKKIARLRVGPDVSIEEWSKIEKEIDSAGCLVTAVDDLVAIHEEGLIDDVTAAVALGLDKKVIEQAKKDRAERIRLTMEAQGGPQAAAQRGQSAGASEFGGTTSSQEKAGKPKRGVGQ